MQLLARPCSSPAADCLSTGAPCRLERVAWAPPEVAAAWRLAARWAAKKPVNARQKTVCGPRLAASCCLLAPTLPRRRAALFVARILSGAHSFKARKRRAFGRLGCAFGHPKRPPNNNNNNLQRPHARQAPLQRTRKQRPPAPVAGRSLAPAARHFRPECVRLSLSVCEFVLGVQVRNLAAGSSSRRVLLCWPVVLLRLAHRALCTCSRRAAAN